MTLANGQSLPTDYCGHSWALSASGCPIIDGMPYFKTPAQVAEDLGLQEATVRRLAREYKTFTRVGVRVMFAPEDMDALIAAIKNPPRVDVGHDPFGPSYEEDPFR